MKKKQNSMPLLANSSTTYQLKATTQSLFHDNPTLLPSSSAKMGCASSKVVEPTVVSGADVYRPPPSSYALFDVSAIEEPWVKGRSIDDVEEGDKQLVHVPAPILEKLDKFELSNEGPHSWSEVSKALEELKPSLHSPKPAAPEVVVQPKVEKAVVQKKPAPTKSQSFHTLDELDKKLSSELKKSESMSEMKPPVALKKTASGLNDTRSAPIVEGFRPVKENMFIVKDRMERGKDGKMAVFRKDPLSDYQEMCPPGGSESIVLYTTSLRGVRRTFEDCSRIRSVIELHGVAFDERDVSLHGQFLNELRDMFEEGVSVPRLFIKGRYIGGADEVIELNELGKLGKLLHLLGKNKEPCSACQGCGGTRFLPCLECGGSCKVVVDDKKERCPKCNENGLVQCPICHPSLVI